MDFSLPRETQALLARFSDFLQREVYPLELAFLNQPFFSIEPELAKVRARVQEAGLWAPQIPKAWFHRDYLPRFQPE